MDHQHVLIDRGLHHRRQHIGEVHPVAALQVRVHHDVAVDREEQRQPVRPRARHRQRADMPGAAGPVLHQHGLPAEFLAEQLREFPRRDVGAAARRIGHDQAQRASGLRRRDAGKRQRPPTKTLRVIMTTVPSPGQHLVKRHRPPSSPSAPPVPS
jgi:hypothetical protein